MKKLLSNQHSFLVPNIHRQQVVTECVFLFVCSFVFFVLFLSSSLTLLCDVWYYLVLHGRTSGSWLSMPRTALLSSTSFMQVATDPDRT